MLHDIGRLCFQRRRETASRVVQESGRMRQLLARAGLLVFLKPLIVLHNIGCLGMPDAAVRIQGEEAWEDLVAGGTLLQMTTTLPAHTTFSVVVKEPVPTLTTQ